MLLVIEQTDNSKILFWSMNNEEKRVGVIDIVLLPIQCHFVQSTISRFLIGTERVKQSQVDQTERGHCSDWEPEDEG